MILILTAREDPHAEIVARELAERKAEYVRFDPAEFTANAQVTVALGARKGSAFVLEHEGWTIDLRRVSAVWYRRPGLPEPDETVTNEQVREWASRESQVFLEGLWTALDCLHVPGMGQHRLAAENKLTQLIE